MKKGTNLVKVNRSMPPGKIIPELVYEDLDEAVVWLCEAFGFTERLRIGSHRAQLVLEGESVIAIGRPFNPADEQCERNADHSLMVRVEDVDQHFERVSAHGAKVINPPENYPYGERQYSVEDTGGHVWTFTQTLEDIDPGEWGGRLLIRDGDA